MTARCDAADLRRLTPQPPPMPVVESYAEMRQSLGAIEAALQAQPLLGACLSCSRDKLTV